MKILGMVNAPGEVSAILRACSKLSCGGDHVLTVVAPNQEVAAKVEREGDIGCRLLGEYAVPEELQKRALLWLDAWADRQGSDGRSLKEALWFERVSLWWFFLPLLAPDFLHCIQYVEAFEAVLDAEKPDIVVVPNAHQRPMLPFRLKRAADLPERVAYLVAKARGYEIRTAKSGWSATAAFYRSYIARRLLEVLSNSIGVGVDRWIRLLLAGWGGRGRTDAKSKASIEKKKKLVLFSTSAYWRETGEVENGKRVEGDVFSGRVVRLLSEQDEWTVLDIDTEVNVPSIERYRRLHRKVQGSHANCVPIERYYTRGSTRRVKDLRARLQGWWMKGSNEYQGEGSLSYHGIPLASLLMGRLDYAFKEYSRTIYQHLEAVEVILETETPDAVLIEYEEGSYGRAATVKSRKYGIPSLALQHGMHAGPYVPAYYFRHVSWEGAGDPLGCPIPTKTAVFGEDTRRMLTEISAYPTESVEVTGSAVYDVLKDQLHRLSPEVARREIGLRPENRVVTVLSSKFVETQYRIWFIDTVLGALRELPQVKTIIKLHPHETPDMWQACARRLGMPEPILLTAKLWETIAAADLVVAWYSTTVLDAMAFGKPVVIVQKRGKDFSIKFVEENKIEVAYDAPHLRQVLKFLFGDERRCRERIRQSREILGEQVFRLDGGAVGRIVELIKRSGTAKEPLGQKEVAHFGLDAQDTPANEEAVL